MAYIFVCSNGHRSYSASRTQYDSSCPECGEPTTMLNEQDVRELLHPHLTGEQLLEKIEELKAEGHSEADVAKELNFEVTELRALKAAATSELRQKKARQVRDLYTEGKSHAAIAEEVGIDENLVRQIVEAFGIFEITPETNIWHPGPDYKGREGDYAKTIGELPDGRTIELVQQRAQEDSLWAIEHGYASDTALMGRMAEWVGEPKNIAQCLERIYSEENAHICTVDWVCRELAKVTQSIARGEASD